MSRGLAAEQVAADEERPPAPAYNERAFFAFFAEFAVFAGRKMGPILRMQKKTSAKSARTAKTVDNGTTKLLEEKGRAERPELPDRAGGSLATG